MKYKIWITIIAITITLAFGGCGSEPSADTSSYSGDCLTVIGVTENEDIITIDELSKLECKSNTYTTMSRKGEITVKAYGPELEEILEKYNLDIVDIKNINVLARDGYRASFDSSFLTNHDEIIFSIANGKDALEEDEQPIRLVIPDAPAEQWVRAVEKIEINCF